MRGLLWKIPFLSLLAGLSWWLSIDQASSPQILKTDASQKADYFLRQFEVIAMNQQGQPQRELQATFMQHFPADDSTELTAPVMHLHSSDKPSWRIESEQGYVSADGDLVLLDGAVDIRRPAAPGFDAIQIHTRNLRVQLPNDYAETDEAVDIKSGIHKMNGVGMQAHFTAPIQIRLLADVGGIHAVQ